MATAIFTNNNTLENNSSAQEELFLSGKTGLSPYPNKREILQKKFTLEKK